ncbi:hypothetical protein ACFSTE_15250 [Aquimarina hainanensis]|uniref:Lipoprotein n=1 Tax=Aquimarina hainanensis TaxID=1578017 RepID=A0ABW5NDE1_9FLAO
MKDFKKIISCIIITTIISCIQKQTEGPFIKTVYTDNPYSKKRYIGKIILKSDLDSIKLGDKDLKSRVLYLGKFKKRFSISELEKMHSKLDTFGYIEEDNDTIYFDYNFTNKGKYFLDGYIEEEVLLDNFYKDGKSRLITNKIKFSKKIRVIEE